MEQGELLAERQILEYQILVRLECGTHGAEESEDEGHCRPEWSSALLVRPVPARSSFGKGQVELRFFGGLELAEIGGILEVTERTVKRDWALARAWLARELGGAR